MKVLIIGKYYHPFQGGIEHATQIYAESLAKDCEVTVIANSHDGNIGESVINGVNLVRLKRHLLLKSQPLAFGLPWSFDLAKFDVVHFHGPNPYAAVVLVLKALLRRRVPPIVVSHHMDIYGRPILRAILSMSYNRLLRMSKWVAVSSFKNAVMSQDLPAGVHLEQLPYCISVADYDNSPKAKQEAAAWRRKSFGDAPLVGFLGRHARYKGIEVLIRSISRLDGVQVAIAGDGPYQSTAIKLARDLGVAERVHFLGHLSFDEKVRLLAAIDVFAFPSTEVTEAFGITQLEAMLMGATVVASNLPTGVTDVAIDKVTAFLARPGDEKHLAEKISEALKMREISKDINQAALEHVTAIFSEEVVLSRLHSLIQSAVAKGDGQQLASYT